MSQKDKKLVTVKNFFLALSLTIFVLGNGGAAHIAHAENKLNVIKCIQQIVSDVDKEVKAAPNDAEKKKWEGFKTYMGKQGLSFLAVLGVSISKSGIMEEIVEPWIDVIARNQCQATDLLALIERKDTIEKQLAKDYLTCNTKKLKNELEMYQKIKAEIYYVRHVVSYGFTASAPFGLSAHTKIAANKNIYSELKKNYVDNLFLTIDDFDPFFGELESKYTRRVPTYIDCPNTAWADVAEKAIELRDFFTEDAAGFNSFAQSVDNAWNRVEKTASAISDRYSNIGKGFATLFTTGNPSGLVGTLVDVRTKGVDKFWTELQAIVTPEGNPLVAIGYSVWASHEISCVQRNYEGEDCVIVLCRQYPSDSRCKDFVKECKDEAYEPLKCRAARCLEPEFENNPDCKKQKEAPSVRLPYAQASLEEVTALTAQLEEKDKLNDEIAELGQKFAAKYYLRDTNAQTLLNELKMFDMTLQETFPIIDGVEQCGKGVNQRQGG